MRAQEMELPAVDSGRGTDLLHSGMLVLTGLCVNSEQFICRTLSADQSQGHPVTEKSGDTKIPHA